MDINLFINKYTYKKDKNYDDWTAIKPDSEGNYYGDCESFCLTMLELGSQGKIYWSNIKEVGHVILIDGEMWIDCNTKRWKKLSELPLTYSNPRRMYGIEIWLRKFKGYVLSLYYKEN